MNTVEELESLADDALNALAAQLRGLRRIGSPTAYCWIDGNGYKVANYRYRPAGDHNQSRELLDWFVRTQPLGRYAIWSNKLSESVCLQAKAKDGVPISIEANGTSARAQTVAFCAAMTVLASQPANAILQSP